MSLPAGSDVACVTVVVNLTVAGVADGSGLALPSSHDLDPVWPFRLSPPLEVSSRSDVMDFYVLM
jgi:hypothetical protein